MKTSGFVLLVLLSTTSFAVKGPAGRLLQPQFSSAPECQERPEFLSEMRNDFLGSLSRLPETVLVAREAEYYIESRDGAAAPVKIHGYQSFLQKGPGSAQVLCGSASAEERARFSLYAPTLIDTNKKSNVGQSLWQFQMMTEGAKYSFWNMKSPSFKQDEALEKWITASGATYKVYQKAHDEYELLLVKNDNGVTQYLSITYDAVPKLK